MARRINNEITLMERAVEMLPAGIPAEAVAEVEIEYSCGEFNGYWIYLKAGYICIAMDCHTIHEDTLADLRSMMATVERWDDDPELEREKWREKAAPVYGAKATEILKKAVDDHKKGEQKMKLSDFLTEEGKKDLQTAHATGLREYYYPMCGIYLIPAADFETAEQKKELMQAFDTFLANGLVVEWTFAQDDTGERIEGEYVWFIHDREWG